MDPHLGSTILLLVCAVLPAVVNGGAPSFTNIASDGSTRTSISETAGTGTSVFLVQATDPDGDTITYSLPGTPANFKITGQEIQVDASLDFDTTPNYVVQVQITDGTDTVTADLNIDLTDVNDETPTFTGSSTASLDEEQVAGTTVPFTFTVADKDAGDTLTYTLTGAHAAYFNVDSTGTITTSQVLDYDITTPITTYSITLNVQDAAGNAMAQALTVTLNDINDNAPICTPNIYYRDVTENTASGTVVATVACTDADTTPNNVITLSIASGDDSTPKFSVSGNDVVTSSTAVDYESATSYTLVIHAVDGGGVAKTGTATLIVTVLSQNEATPSWLAFTPPYGGSGSPYAILENVAIGTSIASAAASDADDGVDGVIKFRLDSTTTDGGSTVTDVFRVDTSTGEISTLTSLDRESVAYYDLVIAAYDGGSPSNTITTTVRVQLNDYNDNGPVFTASSYAHTFPETTTATTVIELITATDADQSSTFSYAVVTGDSGGKFEFDATTIGQLQFKGAINMDQPDNEASYYTLGIEVKDGGVPELTGTATVTITMTAVNDHDPVVSSVTPSASPSLPEDTTVGTVVATVTATDLDFGPDGDLTFTITVGNTNTDFAIDSSSGVITVNKALDVTTTPTYTLTVTVTDGGTTARSVTTTVTVTVTDVNNNSPACTLSTVYVNIVEPAAVSDAVSMSQWLDPDATVLPGLCPWQGLYFLVSGARCSSVVTTPVCSDADSSDTLVYSFTTGNSGGEFAIDSSTGAITLASQVDYDSATKSYTLQVKVTDGTNDAFVNVQVTIDPANEFTPAFASNPTVTMSESESPGFFLTTYVATDNDHAPHAITSYAITAVTNSGLSLFSVDSASAAISLSGSVDYEALPAASKFYLLTVTATDGGSLVGTGTVTVNIDDYNDNAPTCTQATWNVDVAESTTPTATVIAALGCTDAEDGTTLTYSIVQTPGSSFSVAADAVTLTSAVDYETSPSHTLTVTVTDAGSPAQTTDVVVNVNVVNSNDGPPTFAGPYAANVLESASIGTSVKDVVATDPDGSNPLGTPVYSITGGDVNDDFSIDPNSGRVTTNKILDREGVASYALTVHAKEEGGPNSVDTTLTVTIDDVNDETPGCSPTVLYRDVTENTAAASVVATLNCPDGDVSPNGDVTLSIVSGDDATKKFSVSGMDIVTSSTATDYEGKTSYTLIINAIDGGGSPLTGTATLVISILPVNEGTPAFGTFVPAGSSFSLSENSAVGTSIVTVTATDSDSGIDGAITYSIQSVTSDSGSAVTGVFGLDAGTRILSTAQTLDRESAAYYDVVLLATDGGAAPKSSSNTIRVTLTDYNDNAPVFGSSSYNGGSHLETAATAGANVVTVAATDADQTATIAYSIQSGDASKFEFSAGTPGLLQFKIAVNLDQPDNHPAFYTLVVIATDGGSPELTGTASVTVTITAENEHAPVFGATTPTATPSFPESSAVGTVIATVAATDLDVGSDGDITYSITNGNTNTDFIIDPTSGVITTQNALSFAGTPSYTLEVTATDGGTTPQVATTTVTVTVTDVNGNTPSCTPAVVYVNLPESANVNDVVATPTCSDADTSDTLTYTEISGDSSNNFAVDSGTGAVTLSAVVDYDSSVQSYSLGIQVSDGTNNGYVTIKITVDPVNEATPTFGGSFSTSSFLENTSPGTAIHQYVATDTDYSPHDVTAYAITAVTPGSTSLFSIDAATGQIYLSQSLDYDTLPAGSKYHEITVTATDGGGLVGTGTVTVNVGDYNDLAPTCTQTIWNIDVNDVIATFPTTVIAALGCTDPEGTTLTYAMVQSPGTHFSVSADVVTITSDLDYVTAPAHTLTITVTDGATPALSVVVTVNVNVVDVNDGPPTFAGTFSKTLLESVAISTSVSDVVATDPDGNTPAGILVYVMTLGDTKNQFAIDSATGRVSTIANLDREADASYDLVVEAREQGGTNTATTTLTVTVDDVNDNAPSCTMTAFADTVTETQTVTYDVRTLTCTDADTAAFGTLTYTLSSGDTSKFQMSGNIFQLIAALDYDVGPTKYDVVVTVSDGTNSVDVTGTVNVGSVNEFTPAFTGAPYSVSKSESLALGSTVITVVATDGDSSATADGQITYALTTAYPEVTIDAVSGDLILASSLDREGSATLTFGVTASDGTNAVSTTVTLTVLDENDNSPLFASASYTGSDVSEADAAGASVVATVVATDADDPATNGNGLITYSIIGGNTNNDFTIGSSNGQITTANQLDYETTSSYSLIVKALDGGAKSATTMVTVSVTNVNEFDPVFTQTTYTTSRAENTAINSQLVQVIASDNDVGDDGIIDFSMATHATFSLSADGWISLKSSLDFEADQVFSLLVEASDRGTTPQRSATATVSVTVTDVNDNPPVCNPDVVSLTMREDATGTVATMVCSDADTGANAALTYSILSVNGLAGAGPFAVSTAGVLSINTNLDYETDVAHAIVVSVVDDGAVKLSTSVIVNVAVTDVNEFSPVLTGSPFAYSFPESDPVGTTLLTIAATDGDGSDTLSFSLSDTSVLAIDSTSGVITLKVQQNREATSAYSLNVCATDSNTVVAVRTTCVALDVTVTDVNDNTPVFSPAVYSQSVDENTAIGTSLLKVTATDPDLGAEGTVSYSIFSGNTGTVFRIDPVVGDLIINDDAALDYEVNPSFDLVIRATDGGGLVGSATVRIATAPVNEATPQFSPSSSTQTLAEDSALGTAVIDLDATDADDGADGVITYSIVSGGNGKFAIDPTTGIVTVSGVLDRESAQSYTLTVNAVDGGTNPGAKTGTYTLIVDITDVNDVTPSCTLTYYTSTISEAAAPATIVGQVTCTDGDLDPANLNNDLAFAETGGDSGGLFDVNANTGEITVSSGASFDRETTPSYLLDISVSDKGTTPLSVSVQMFIGLIDVNDKTPVFGSNPYSASVPEADAIGTTVTTIAATDGDTGVNAMISYSVTTGNELGHFQLDSVNGDITIKSALDFETTPLYTLVVEATDKGSPALTGTSTVSISVTNVNDITPVCPNSVYTTSVAEDAATSTSLLTVACTDGDGDTVQYSITGGLTGTEFAIGASTGEITVNDALDAESAATYSLTVQASDGAKSALVTVEITVTDVNEFDPAFAPAGPYAVSVPEDSVVGFTVKTINAADADVSDTNLMYGISNGNTGSAFQMDSVTGVVQVKGVLDRETLAVYSLTIDAADGTGTGSRTAQTTLTVTVTDVNDNDPVCSPTNYYQTVAENAATGTTVETVLCTDQDSSTPVLAYSITGGNSDGKFDIDAASGVVTIAANLDYETTTQYTLVVKASDQGTTPRTATAVITVMVDPVNEATPVFSPTSYTKSLLEDTAINTVVVTVAATDPDKGNQHGTIKYAIISGDGLAQFNIDASSGLISVAKPLNREALASYTLTVTGTDSVPGAAEAKSSSVIVTVTVDDVNDNTPAFTPSSYTANVLESAVSGTTVLRVTSTDDDTGVNSSPLYSILSGNTNSEFEFVGDELLIAAGKNLDYESITSYTLTIEVKDQGTTQLSSTGIINVNVLSVNEFQPVFVDATKTMDISETTPAGANLYNASASDSDSGIDGTFTYSFTGGNSDNLFYINSLSGEVFLFGILDYDTPPQSYSLTIKAEDAGGLSNTMTLTVNLLDENDHTPVFTANTYNAQLDENVAGGTSVTQVTANDNDSGGNGQVTYALVSGDGLTTFDIDSATGEIKTKAAASIDREVKDQYFLVVKAADGGATSLSSSCLVKISINDLNDNQPVFVPSSFTVSIDETSTVGTSVTTVMATDADSAANGNNIIVYTLTDTFFTVDSASGQVDTKAILDRETVPSHLLTIEATDQGAGPLTGTASITVAILDVNDNDPVIQGTYTTSVLESIATGTIVFTITATDADSGVNSQLTFSITNGNTDTDFRIESQSGIIDIVNSLNRERTASYNLEVTVTDNGTPPRAAVVTAVVTVDDVNDNDPVFGAASYSFNVAEDAATSTSIGAVVATDDDTGANAALVYEFVMFWVGDATHFAIDGVTGDITTSTTALDRETADTYSIWCRVQDGGSPFRTANVNVTVTVTDVNDNQPAFDQTSYSVSVLENSAVGTSIATYTVTDLDTGANGAVTLSIDTSTAAGTLANTFLSVDSVTGILSVLTVVDRETNQLFEFTVVAVDGGTPARTGTATCTVTVLDENDNAPVHAQTFYNAEVAYTGACSNVVTTLSGTDADSGVNGQVSYFLVQSNFDDLFAVDGTSGVVTLQTTATANYKYILEAGVRDNGSPVLTSTNLATLRIDTFDPNTVVAVFRLQISEADFLLKKDEFLTSLNAIIQAVYPTATTKIWCTQEREGTATTPGRRRRLLATAPVDVLVYTVADDTTDSQANSALGKSFLTSGSVLALTTSDANGSPSAAITGTAFDYYGIESVSAYYQVTTPWHQTPTGIAIIIMACVLTAVLIGLLVYLIFRTCRKRGQRPITPVRPKDYNRNKPIIENKKTPLVTHRGYVPDLDQDPKKHPLPVVAALPMPAKPNTATKFWGAPEKKPESKVKGEKDTRLSSAPHTPRSIIIQPREFTGKAVDPVTNKVYEYNTKTNERKWVVTPVGKPAMGSDDIV